MDVIAKFTPKNELCIERVFKKWSILKLIRRVHSAKERWNVHAFWKDDFVREMGFCFLV